MEEARVPLGDLGLLARAVVRCLSVLVPLWPPAGQMLVGHFGRSAMLHLAVGRIRVAPLEMSSLRLHCRSSTEVCAS